MHSLLADNFNGCCQAAIEEIALVCPTISRKCRCPFVVSSVPVDYKSLRYISLFKFAFLIVRSGTHLFTS